MERAVDEPFLPELRKRAEVLTGPAAQPGASLS
jgi:hypothetical protein